MLLTWLYELTLRAGFLPRRAVKPRAKVTHRYRLRTEELEGRAVPALLTAVAAEPGTAPFVRLYDTGSGAETGRFLAYSPGMTTGFQVAMGDVNADGVTDVITAAGAGGAPHVKVFDGRDYSVMASFFGFSESFTGGANLAVGDVDGDRFADIILGAGAGGDAHLKVFSGRTGAVLVSTLAYAKGYTGGVNVSAGDIDGDGRVEILTSAGAGGGPHVKVFSSRGELLQSFYAFDPSFLGGLSLGAGDLDGDGRAEIVIGAGPGGTAHVKVFDGPTGVLKGSFLAFDASFRGGVSVGVTGDINRDGKAEIIVIATGTNHVERFQDYGNTLVASYLVSGTTFRGGGTTASVPVPPNLPPVGHADAVSGDAGTVLAGNVLANDTDENGDGLTVVPGQIVTDGGVAVTMATDGTFTYDTRNRPEFAALPEGALAVDRFRYTVTDGILTATGEATVTVRGVNDAPVVAPLPTQTVNEGQPLTFVVPVSDVDGDPLVVTATSLPSGAAFDQNTRTFTWTPSYSDAGNHTATFDVTDGRATVSRQVAITVANVNRAPTITSSNAANAAENQTGALTVTATDPDASTTLTYSISGGADAARFSIDSSTGVLTFTGAPNFEAPTDANADNVYLVQVQVSDGSLTASQNVSVTVTDVNETPTITSSSSANAAENQTGALTVTATDPDAGATLTYSITGGADQALFSINSSTGVLTFNSAPNFAAPADANADNVYLVTVQVSDGSLTASQNVSVTVTNVNDPPTITSGSSASVAENQTGALTVTATDPDLGTTLTYSITGGADAARFSINSSTGALTFNSAPNFEAPADANADNVYLVQVQASDGSLTASQNVSITVTNVNETPSITSSSSANAAENQTGAMTVTATDPDAGSTLTYSITGGADQALFSINSSTGALTFTSAPNFEAPADANADNVYLVQVQVSDGSLTASQNVSVTVTNVNETPSITSGSSTSVAENQTGALTVTATDPDLGTTLTYSITGGADQARFSINSSTGVLTFNSAPNFESPTDANGDNVYLVQVQVSDGSLTASQNVSVTVTNVNEAPTITSSATANAAENQTGALTVTATDPEGAGVTYSITGGADQALFSINSSTGVLTFNSAPNFEAPADANADNLYVVQIQASDGGLTTAQTLSVSVTNVNEAPSITSASSASVAENLTAVLTVVATDPDAGTTLTYSITGGADAARFSINSSTGALTFNPAPNFEAPADANGDNVYLVQVQASDGSLTASQTVTVTVTDVNEAPVIITGPNVSAAENQTTAHTIIAGDPEGVSVTYSITGGADQALFSINSSTGVLTFNSPPNFEAPADANADNVYLVTIQVSDGSLTASQNVSVTVTNVNEAPTITSSNTANAAENQTGALTVTATDPDAGATLTYSITGGADQALFSINSSTGVLTFNAPPNYESPADANADNVYLVQVQASDGSLTASQNVSVTVTNVNEAPTITSSNAANAAENQTGALTVTATDPDAGTTLTYSITGGADQALFSINSSTGVLTFNSAPNFEAPADANADNVYLVQVQASDGSLTASQNVSVTVTNVNEAPTITSSATANAAENQTGALTVTATDPDAGATLTYSITGGADQALFSINSSTGVLTFTSGRNYESPTDANGDNVYLVQVQVSDGSLTASQNISVTVTDVNEAPSITSSATANAAENQTGALTVTATDPDAGATLTYSITGGADQALFSINSSTGALTFNAPPNYESPADANGDNVFLVQVQASDGSLTASQNVSVTVTNVNEAPTITSSNAANAAENQTGALTVTATDPDAGASLTYAITGGADQALFSINSSTGVLTFNAPPNFESPADANADNVYLVQVQVSDGSLTASQNVSVTVTNVNEAPTITSSATANAAENQTGAMTVTATDPDAGTTLTYSITGGADQALFSINSSTGALTFTSGRNYESPTDANADNVYLVQVQVSDGSLTASQNVSITVTDVNEAPTITSSNSANAAENQTSALTVTATDPDAGATLTYSITGGADQALFSINSSTGALTFNAPPNYESPADANGDNVYLVTVQVSDGSLTANQNVSVTVTNVNEAPTITSSATANAAENQTGALTVTATDPDAGATLTYSITGGADQALFSINSSTGVLTFNSAPNFEAPADANADNVYLVQVQASDGSLTTSQNVSVAVTNVNESPTITSSATANAAENQTGALTVTATDPDAGTTLTYSITGGADQALFSINSSTGVLTFNSAPNFEAPADANADNVYLVQVQASDGSLTASQNISVTVTDVNEAPSITSSATANAAENQTGALTVTATDPDAGATLTYSITGGADQALFSINSSTGVLTFNAPPNYESPADANADNVYLVQVQVSDGSLTASQNVSVTVTNVNESPSITSSATANAAENQTGALTVTATDPDAGASLTYAIIGGADQALFSINSSTGVLTFNGAPNFEAPADANADNVYLVTIQVSDGSLTASQNVSITVTDVNEAPTITSSATANAAENQTGALTVTATDPDAGATLTYSIIGGADQALFSINSSTGVLTFTSGRNYESPTDANGDNVYLVQVQVSDGSLTANQNVSITVTNVNEAPSITSSATANAAENQTGALTVTATDPDAGASLTYSITGGADQALFSINSSTGALTFTSGRNYESPTDANGDNVYLVQVQVSDGSLTASQNVSITVTDVDEAPSFSSANSANAAENQTGALTVTATDPEGAGVTYSIIGGADQALFGIDANTGVLTFNAPPNYEAPADANADNVYLVQVQASDGSLTTNQSISITVTNVNESPTITSSATANAAENQTGALTVTATDPDASTTLTYSIIGGADQALFSINSSTGALTFTSGRNYESPTDANGDNVYLVQVQVSDGSLTASQNVSITVTDVDEAPSFSSANSANAAENQTGALTVTATDPEGAGVTYSIIGGADQALFGIDANTGVLTFNSPPNFEAPADANADNVYLVQVQASDGSLTTNQSISITVTNVNEAPTITSSATANAAENQTGALTVTATDPDAGTTLTYSITGGADQALFSINSSTGVLTFTSARNYESPTDANADNVYLVTVRASDGSLTASQNVSITVTDVNDAPVAANKSAGTNEDTVLNDSVSASDEDQPPQTLTYSLVGNVSHGSLTFNSDGTFAYTPAANYNGTDTFTFRANDGTVNSNTATVTITVTNVDNDPPTITLPSAPTTAEDTPLTINGISVADPDAGSSPVKVTLVSLNGVMTLSTTAGLTFTTGDGTADPSLVFTGTLAQVNAALSGLVFTPDGNYNGSTTLFFTVDDQGYSGTGGAQTASASLGVTVSAVNDAPTVSVPASASTNEDSAYQFFTVAVADVDAASSAIQVTLTVTHGTLTLASLTGLTFSAGDGTADATMTFTGTVANINAALSGMAFTPAADYNGTAHLDVGVNDQGNTGSGGALSASGGVDVAIAAVNDAPVITSPSGTLSATVGSPFAFTGGNAIGVTDVDGGSGQFTVTLLVSKGTLTLTTTGLTFDIGDGTNDNAMQFNGTLAQIQAALASLFYTPSATGAATLSIIVDDNGNVGSGGSRSDSASVLFTNS